MRRTTVPTLMVALLLTFGAREADAVARPTPSPPAVPLAFEPNVGQTDPAVRYLARARGYTFFLTAEGAVLRLAGESGHVLRLRLDGARADAPVTPLERMPGVVHYYRGNRPEHWRTDVPRYGRLRLAEVYPGVDLLYYADGGDVRYDLVVAPGADPGAIAWLIEGAEGFELEEGGALRVLLAGGDALVMPPPFVWQEARGKRREVRARYRLGAGGRLGFELGAYDASAPLVIDPALVYSTYLGGTGRDIVRDVATDEGNGVWLAGVTDSPDFPGGVGVPRHSAAFVTRLRSDGTLRFTVYLDGDGVDVANAIAVDSRDIAHVAGGTTSEDFPTTFLAFQRERQERPDFCFPVYCFPVRPFLATDDAVAFRIHPEGNLIYSTYLGGGDPEEAFGVGFDTQFRTVVAGFTQSGNFPLAFAFRTAHRGAAEGFLTVIDDNRLSYSTFIGGRGGELVRDLAMRGDHAYVVGATDSDDLATRASSGEPFRDRLSGPSDAFVARFDTTAGGDASLVAATYLGGSGGDSGRSIAVDPQGSAYVTGLTRSSDFPLAVPRGGQLIDGTASGAEAFVSKLASTGSFLQFSTYLGGNFDDEGLDIEVDTARMVYVLVLTESGDLTERNGFQEGPLGGQDLFVAKIDPLRSELLWSSYFGGSGADGSVIPGTTDDAGLAVDRAGNVYLGGGTTSGDLPVVAALQPGPAGNEEGFLAKVEKTPPDTVGVFRPSAGEFLLRNANRFGPPDFTVALGTADDVGVSGDWTGFGFDKPGTFRDGDWVLRPFGNAASHPFLCCLMVFNFGAPGDLPVVGDWDGDGVDTIGVFRNAQWLLRNTNGPGNPDLVILFGAGDDVPVVGDWDGDGDDNLGVFRPSTGQFVLDFDNGGADDLRIDLDVELAADLVPVAGDWNGDGIDEVGVFRSGTFLLRRSLTSGPPDLVVPFGIAGDLPVVGNWDGQP